MMNFSRLAVLIRILALAVISIQLVSSHPTPSPNISCMNVSFLAHTIGVHSNTHSGPSGRGSCYDVSSETPTTITIDDQYLGCRYNVVRYSGKGCLDNEKMGHMKPLRLNSSHRMAKLNERKPVCSFKLQHDILPGRQCVTVNFDGGNTVFSKKQLCEAGNCVNLPGQHCENIYPSRVGVYVNGSLNANIGIYLYSSFHCGESTLLKDESGNAIVRGDQNLEPWTRQNNETVGSFLLNFVAAGTP